MFKDLTEATHLLERGTLGNVFKQPCVWAKYNAYGLRTTVQHFRAISSDEEPLTRRLYCLLLGIVLHSLPSTGSTRGATNLQTPFVSRAVLDGSRHCRLPGLGWLGTCNTPEMGPQYRPVPNYSGYCFDPDIRSFGTISSLKHTYYSTTVGFFRSD